VQRSHSAKTFSNKQKIATLIALFLLPCVLFIALRGIAGSNSDLYGQPARIAELENQSINESSGIAASKRNTDILWTHNDSGDGPFVYAFDRAGKSRGVWQLTGAEARDWEDMAVGPGPKRGRFCLYLGDIGDNARRRDEIIVYRVTEPVVTTKSWSSSKQNPVKTEPAEAIRLNYPDGKHDAEALLVHPSTGDLYIVSKVRGTTAGVYKLKAPFPKAGVSTLAHIADVQFPAGHLGLITGGDISPDGRRVILCDYFRAYEFILENKRGIAFDDIWKQTPATVNLGARRQGEAICYRADSQALFATSEGQPCPLIEIPRQIEKQ